jgi:outer membrane cobalamin receptor
MDTQAEHGVDNGYLDIGPVKVPTYYALDRTMWSGFIEARYNITQAFSLSGSGRYDSVGSTDHLSPQARADYSFLDWGTNFQLMWGKAYKLPSFYSLGNPIVGDSNLKPEEAENFEGGLSQRLWDLATWKFEAYATDYRDLIDFAPGAVPKLVNLSSVHTRGLETSVDLSWGSFTATPRLSYTNARNQQTGAVLLDVPSWLAGATLLWRPNSKWDLSFDINHVGSLVDNSVPTGDVTLPGHVRADLAAHYGLLPNLALQLGVDNVFNAHYQDVVGFSAPGTVVRGGLTASL